MQQMIAYSIILKITLSKRRAGIASQKVMNSRIKTIV